MNDTAPEIDSLWRARLMALSPEERLAMASSQFDFARELVEASILTKVPSLSRERLRAEIFLRFYAEDFSPEFRNQIMVDLLSS